MFSLSQNTTLISRILQNEFKEMKNAYQANTSHTSTYGNGIFQYGSTMFPIDIQKESFNKLSANKDAITFCTNIDTYNSAHEFINHFRGNVVTVNTPVTYREALNIISQYIAKAGKHFYGAVLRANNGYLYNPVHPLTAIAAIKEKVIFDQSFKLILYFYKDRDAVDIEYLADYVSQSVIQEHLQELLKLSNSEGKSTSYCTSVTEDPKQPFTLLADYRNKIKFNNFKNIHNSSSNSEYYLIAHQVLTKGVYYPYYGSSVISKGKNSSQGMPLSPFLAVNIGGPNRSGIKHDAQTWHGVCTGNQPQATMQGLSTLSHCNLKSPMNSNSILSGATIYADACINLALTLYTKAGYLDNPTQIPTRASNAESRIKDYLNDNLQTNEAELKFLHQLNESGALDGYKSTTNTDNSTEITED